MYEIVMVHLWFSLSLNVLSELCRQMRIGLHIHCFEKIHKRISAHLL